MKFSEKWLRSWANPQVSHDELVARLSMVGLEVDADLPVAGAFSGVVVGEVLSTEQHPDADKLRVCQVSNGSETFQVVCGAPNVRAGLKIPFAMIGAELPGDFKIKAASFTFEGPGKQTLQLPMLPKSSLQINYQYPSSN